MEFFTHAAELATLAVVLVHQILKLNIVPTNLANKYPVPTNIILSTLASLVVVYQGGVHIVDWTGWLLLVASVSVTAAIVYNVLIKPWVAPAQTPITFLPAAPVVPATVDTTSSVVAVTPVADIAPNTPVVVSTPAPMNSAEAAIAQSVNPPTTPTV